MKPNEEVTIWYRWNVNKKVWLHNHIEEGWSSLDAPLPKSEKQAKVWKGAKWQKHWGNLLNGKVLGRWIYPCLDCGINTIDPEDNFTNHYSVHDHVWEEATGTGDLCLNCLRERLGRDLQLSDFMLEYEDNDHINQELLDRINQ